MDVQPNFHVEWFHSDGRVHSGVVTRLWFQDAPEKEVADRMMASVHDNRGYLVHVEVGKLRDPRQVCLADEDSEE